MDNTPGLQFPTSFDIKIIVSNTIPAEQTKNSINEVFNKVMTANNFVGETPSKNGTYTCYTYTVLLLDRPHMDELYNELKTIEGFKMAI